MRTTIVPRMPIILCAPRLYRWQDVWKMADAGKQTMDVGERAKEMTF